MHHVWHRSDAEARRFGWPVLPANIYGEMGGGGDAGGAPAHLPPGESVQVHADP